MNQHEFQFDRYPDAPGSKERGGTSEEAAAVVALNVNERRETVLSVIRRRPSTPSEIAAVLQWDVTSVRPRCSELWAMRLVRKTIRRRNAKGNNEWVLEVSGDGTEDAHERTVVGHTD